MVHSKYRVTEVSGKMANVVGGGNRVELCSSSCSLTHQNLEVLFAMARIVLVRERTSHVIC